MNDKSVILLELIERIDERKRQGMTNTDLAEFLTTLTKVVKQIVEEPCCRD